MSEIICIEKLDGERIILEVVERGTSFLRTKNPMSIIPLVAEGKISFGPYLYTKPQNMTSKLYFNAIAEEYEPAEDIVAAYQTYVKHLTSSIIQLDNSIKKIQING